MTRRLLGIALALVLTGLGGLTSAEAAKTRIVVGLAGGSGVHAPEMIERFRELNPDIEVEPLIMSWGQFFDKLPLMLVSGVAPDVWYGEAGRALGWYEAGFTEDLAPYVERDLALDDYFFLDAAKDPKSGAWTGIPSDFQVTSLFYNTQHFLSNGIVFPDERWTLADLVDAGKKLTLQGADETLRWGFAMQPEYITAGWMLWMKLMGGGVLDQTRTDSRLMQPENAGALESMLSLMYEQRISPTPGVFGFAPWEAFNSFQDGRASMMFNIYAWNKSLGDVGMDQYDVAVTPMGPSGRRFTTAVPNVWVINADTTDAKKEAAWRWIAYQIGEEAQHVRMSAGAGVPVNRHVAFDFVGLPGAPENRQIYIDSYAFAGTLEENAVWEEYRLAIEQALLPVWEAKVTPNAALLNAHEKIERILHGVS